MPEAEFTRRLSGGELLLELPPFVARLRSNVGIVAHDLRLMYPLATVCEPAGFADFHIEVRREAGPRGWLKPMARFYYDGKPAFLPLPAPHGYTMVEWGLNWCVASHAHQYLIIHAAVLERDGRALILPAPPGSGKSTLTAALALRGWRLLSDELALYRPEDGTVLGMARPINLKNRSIDVIRAFEPAAVMTVPVPDTAKGTVALLRPPEDAVRRVHEPARPSWVVLPRWQAGAAPRLTRHDRSQTLLLVAEQSFNYDLHGEDGFLALVGLIGGCDCYQFSYGTLADAVQSFDQLARGIAPCVPA